MHYQSVDRGIHWDFGYLTEAMDRWVDEGLPRDIGGAGAPGDRMGRISAYFGKDPTMYVPVHLGLHPGFPYEVIEVRERTVVHRDGDGNIVEEIKEGEHTIPHVIENGLKSRADWEKYKAMLDPADPARHQWDYKALAKQFNEADVPVVIGIGSFVGWIRNWVGAENLGYLVYDDPDLFSDMVNTLCDLFVAMLEPALKEIEVDLAWGWEDICFNNGPLVGPNIWRKYVSEPMGRVCGLLRRHGVDVILTDCDGNVQALAPVWMEAGLNGMFPCEVAGNSDPVLLRQQLGKDGLLFGGFNKRMLKSKETILEELRRLAPLVEDGGFVPFIDHRIPGYVSYENHRYYEREKLAMLGFSKEQADAIEPLRGMPATVASVY
jgi:uroporphyrinogen decarboxylase